MITTLNHFNVATRNLDWSAAFYEKLGMVRVDRPKFPTIGIWLSAFPGGPAVLHLNDAREVGPIVEGTAAVHHVGFSVTGSVDEITARLDEIGIEYDLWDPIPGVYRALYFKGPDGEAIEFVMVDNWVPLAAEAPAREMAVA